MVRVLRGALCACAVFFAVTVPGSAQPFVYVGTNDAFNASGHIYQFTSGMGLLSPLVPALVTQDTRPTSVAVTPDGTSLYAGGNDVITQWDIQPDGTLAPKPVPFVATGGSSIVDITVSPDGRSLYASDRTGAGGSEPESGRVLQFDVGPGGLTPKSPASVTVSGPGYVAVSTDSRSVYVDSWIARIAQFTAGADGTLSPKSPAVATSLSYSDSFVMSPDGSSMYSYTFGYAPDNDPSKPWPWAGFIEQFDIAADGTLRHKSTPWVHVPSGLGQGLAIAPDGASVYATSSVGNAVSQYDVGAGGLLSLKDPPTAAVPNPTGCCQVRIALTPDGRAAYVTASGSSVAQMAVNPDGSLTARSEGGGAVLIGGSNTTGGLAVTEGPRPTPARVLLTPMDSSGLVSLSHTVTASVLTSGGAPVGALAVRFSVSGSVTTDGACTTGADGRCSWSYAGPDLPGADQIKACADGDASGTADAGEPCQTATRAWLLPSTTTGMVTGGGQIANRGLTDQIAFGFNAKSDRKGVRGDGTVVDPSTNTKLKLTTATAMVASGDEATIFGDALLNGVATTYRLDVADHGEPGAGTDTFRLHTASGYLISGTLLRGNIQTH